MKARSRAAAINLREAGAPSPAPWSHPALVAAAATLALYATTVRFGFVWDDLRLVSLNPMLRTWPGVLRALVSDFWVATGNQSSGLWRPLVTASYALDGVLFRWQAWGFHLVNVLAAAGVAALVVAVSLQAGARRPAALLAGLWFAAMPHHVESIAWIAGRTDVYAAALFLLAYAIDRRADRAGHKWPGVAALVTLALALLTKESCAPFLAVVFVAHAAARRDRPWRACAAWVAPYAALTLVYLVAHVLVVRTPPPPAYLSSEMIARGRMSAFLMLPGFLGFLAPFAAHTPATILRLPEHWTDAGVLAGIALQAAWVGMVAALAVRRSRFAAPLLLFWITLLPTFTANLFQAYLLFSERFVYLPSAGLAWAAALALSPLLGSKFGRVGVALAGGVFLGACAVATLRTVPDWTSEDTVYTSMTEKGPRNAQGWILLARLRFTQNRDAEAERALAHVERIAEARPEAYSIRALLFYRHGDWPRVLEYAERAIHLDPTLVEPRLLRATALLRTGRTAEATAAIDALLQAMPDNSTVASLEGQRLLALRRPQEALPYLRRAAEFIHDDPDLYYAMGLSYALVQDLPRAREAFAESVRIDPTICDAWMRLATACHLLGDEAARDDALARAAALPEAADGRVEALRRRFLGTPR
jgi:tetratricopeptide (TPR) repeat protein